MGKRGGSAEEGSSCFMRAGPLLACMCPLGCEFRRNITGRGQLEGREDGRRPWAYIFFASFFVFVFVLRSQAGGHVMK